MSAEKVTPNPTAYYVIGGAWETSGAGSTAFTHPLTGESLAIMDEYDDTESWSPDALEALQADLATDYVKASDTIYVARSAHDDYQGRPMWATYRVVVPEPEGVDDMTTLNTARRIAADVVKTAEQYPAVRNVDSFSALHDIYDANESIAAACGGEVHPNDEAWCEGINAATALVDDVLECTGFNGLVRFAQEPNLTPDDIAAVIAEYDRVVRINEATHAVVEDIHGEVVWEVWEVAEGMGFTLTDNDHDALQIATDHYQNRLRAEIAGQAS